MLRSSKNYEESGYNFDVNLPTISYQSCVLYPMRSGLVGKGNHLRLTSRPNMKIFIFVFLEIDVGHLGWASRYMGIEGNANAIYDFPKICNFALFVLCIQPSKKSITNSV